MQKATDIHKGFRAINSLFYLQVDSLTKCRKVVVRILNCGRGVLKKILSELPGVGG
jgi:hypothetical protein